MNKCIDSTENTARFPRLTRWELNWCLRFNGAIKKQGLITLFMVVSKLGDGVFWYLLMASMMLTGGQPALPAVGRMLATGLLCLMLYKWLKAKTGRPRPFTRNGQIRVSMPPLDQFSFPSGHTLHAVAFSIVAVSHQPRLGWLVLPFTILVALSRLVLGLHYPSDVLAGALLGAGIALLVLQY